ncbi:MAG: transposase [Cyanobacteria bacterium J06650_10]
MIKLIIHPSEILLNFLLSLQLTFSQPQQRHLQRLVEALIVSRGRKTLASLYRQWVDAPDESAVSDFLRVSPLTDDELNQSVSGFALRDLLRRAELEGVEPVLYVSVDDSLTHKDKATHALAGVDIHHDHNASSNGRAAYGKGMVHVSCRIQVGAHSYPFAWRLYLRAKTVRRLNRTRAKGERLRFKSKYQLTQELLQTLKAQLPDGWQVYVLMDSWYGSAKLLKFIHRQGWHCLCAIKSNRTLDGIKLSEWNRRFKHQRYTSAEVSTASGKRTTFLTRQVCGRLKNLPFDVCVIISKRHPRDSRPKYYLSTDLTLSVSQILKRYLNRWPIEQDYWYLKECLGLGDFRVQHYEAIHKWYGIVHLTLTFLYWQMQESWDSPQPLFSIAEVIHHHQQKHARDVLLTAAQQAIDTGNLDAIVNRFTITTQAVA